MTLADVGGLIGVALMLGAYAGAQLRWLDPTRLTALIMNLIGSSLVMLSLARNFNLSAFMMEAAWAVVAIYGLGRLALARLKGE
jgi:hypothetical protein